MTWHWMRNLKQCFTAFLTPGSTDSHRQRKWLRIELEAYEPLADVNIEQGMTNVDHLLFNSSSEIPCSLFEILITRTACFLCH